MTDLLEKLKKATEFSPYAAFFVPKAGVNAIIRLIPVDPPVVEYKEHFLKWSFVCTANKGRCPVCEISERFQLPDMKAYKRFLFYVWDTMDKEQPIKLWAAGAKIAQSINFFVNQKIDLLDPVNGIPLVIRREGQGLKTTYNIYPKEGAKLPLPSTLDWKSVTPLDKYIEDKQKDDLNSLAENISNMNLDYSVKQSILAYLTEQGYIHVSSISPAVVEEEVGNVAVEDEVGEEGESVDDILAKFKNGVKND